MQFFQHWFKLIVSLFTKILAAAVAVFSIRWLNNTDNVSAGNLQEFNLILTAISVILAILSLGIPSLILKFYTNNPPKKYANFWTTILLLQIILYFCGLFLIFITNYIFEINNFLLFALTYTFQYFLVLDLNFKSIADCFNRSWIFSLTDLVFKIVLVVLLYSLTSFKIGIYLFVYLSILVYFFQFATDWFIQRKYTKLGNFEFDILKQNLHFFYSVGVYSVLMVFYSQADKFILDFYKIDPYEFNGYVNAYKIIEITSLIATLFGSVVASFIKKEVDAKPILIENKLTKIFLKSPIKDPKSIAYYTFLKWFSVYFFINFLAMCSLILFKSIPIKILDPNQVYATHTNITLNYLAFAIIPVAVVNFSLNILIILNQHLNMLLQAIFITFVTLVLYFLLIPSRGYVGASIASLIAVSLDCLLRFALAIRYFNSYVAGLSSSNKLVE